LEGSGKSFWYVNSQTEEDDSAKCRRKAELIIDINHPTEQECIRRFLLLLKVKYVSGKGLGFGIDFNI